MKKFKIFHSTVNDGADVAANEWLEQNPDVKVIDFQYTRRNLSGDYNHLCILYEEPEKKEELVKCPHIPNPMLHQYDAWKYQTKVWCPECGYYETYPGDVNVGEKYCPECAKRRSEP